MFDKGAQFTAVSEVASYPEFVFTNNTSYVSNLHLCRCELVHLTSNIITKIINS